MNRKNKSKSRNESESLTLEFKAADAAIKDVAQTVVAFLNSEGGRLLIGISDSGQAVGILDPEGYIQELREFLAKNVSPQDTWSTTKEEIDGVSVVAVDVPAGANKPYLVQGLIYIRHGSHSEIASSDDISALISKNKTQQQRWEREPALGSDLADLDTTEIRKTRDIATESGRSIILETSNEAILHQLGLYREGSSSNAALVLFGKTPARYYPQIRARLTVYQDNKGSQVFEMDRLFESNLFQTASEIEELLGPYSRQVRSTFSSDSWQRIDRPRYPMAALREGVMNALIHRDYSSPSGGVTIGIYPDRIEIWNFGKLPKEITPQDLRKTHPSLPRNPDIAHVCFLHGLIDKVGRGTQKIIEECRNAGLKAPKWDSRESGTTLTFFAPPLVGKLDELNARISKIIELLKTHNNLKATQISELLGSEVTARTVRNDLLDLIHYGSVVREGNGPSTSYRLARKENR